MFRTILHIALLLLVAQLCAVRARAQQTPWRWAAWAAGALPIPSSDFHDLPGVTSCRVEEGSLRPDGGGLGAFGGELGWRSHGSMFEISTRLGLTLGTQIFAAQESIGSVTDNSGVLRDMIVEYRSDVERLELRLEPGVRWYPMSPLVVSAGLVAALPLRTSFDQTELLVAPSQATYLDGSSERALGEGTLDGSPWIGLSAGLGLELDAGAGVVLRPELGAVFALSSPVAGLEWRPHELRAGLSVIFGAEGESTPIAPYPRESEE